MARAQTSRSRTPEADEEAVDPALPQKRRARHRLIGAAALSLVAAVVIPLVFEPEPARSPHDVSITIPSRDTTLPGKGGASVVEVPRPPEPTVTARAEPSVDTRADTRAEPVTESKADSKADPKTGATAQPRTEAKADARPAAKAEPKAESKSAAKGESKSDAKADAKSDAKAKETRAAENRKGQPDEIEKLVESSRNRKPQTAGKYVLQVGAFSSEASAAGAVEKARAAGVKVYTEKVSTERGERIRVRVGPFATREAADEARASLKAAGVTAATIAP